VGVLVGVGMFEVEDGDGVLIGVDGQLAKSVEVGLTRVMMLVTIRGTVADETLPSGNVCTETVKVVRMVVDMEVENKVRVGVGAQAAIILGPELGNGQSSGRKRS